MIADKFQIHSVEVTGKHICESKKINLFILTHVPKQNSPPGLYHHHSRQMEITHFHRTAFFTSRKGKDYGAEKMAKIKLVRVLVTSFDKFHHFCNLYVFGLCFVVA